MIQIQKRMIATFVVAMVIGLLMGASSRSWATQVGTLVEKKPATTDTTSDGTTREEVTTPPADTTTPATPAVAPQKGDKGDKGDQGEPGQTGATGEIPTTLKVRELWINGRKVVLNPQGRIVTNTTKTATPQRHRTSRVYRPAKFKPIAKPVAPTTSNPSLVKKLGKAMTDVGKNITGMVNKIANLNDAVFGKPTGKIGLEPRMLKVEQRVGETEKTLYGDKKTGAIGLVSVTEEAAKNAETAKNTANRSNVAALLALVAVLIIAVILFLNSRFGAKEVKMAEYTENNKWADERFKKIEHTLGEIVDRLDGIDPLRTVPPDETDADDTSTDEELMAALGEFQRTK